MNAWMFDQKISPSEHSRVSPQSAKLKVVMRRAEAWSTRGFTLLSKLLLPRS